MKSESGTTDAVFFAATEVVSFLFLFFSPFLSPGVVQLGWFALVFWRMAALGGMLYYGVSGKPAFLARSVLYGAPFWASSVFFPLAAGQQQAVGRALVVYLISLVVVGVLSHLRTHWYPGLIGLSTFAYLHYGSVEIPWFGALAGLVLLWPRRPFESLALSRSSLQLVSSAAGAGWAFCLYLAVVGGPAGLTPLSLALLNWSVLVAAATDILGQSRSEQERHEIEWSLPSLREALQWKYSRRLYRTWMPWVVTVAWAPGIPRGFLMGFAVVVALPGLVFLASRRREDSLQLFVCWQFVILWGMAESFRYYSLAWVPVALLTTFYLRTSSVENQGSTLELCAQQHMVEASLRNLLQPAPEGFAQNTMRVIEPSVDLDETLQAAAPKGFRERLLQRLSRGESEAPEE